MDSTDPQGSPGDDLEDNIAGPVLTTNSETDLDDWPPAGTDLSGVQKDVHSESRLLFLTVEYVEEPSTDYGQSAFAGFEPGTPFSPQQSASLSDFEHRVSPLDPNMGSTARYSPVYTMSGSISALSTTRELSSGGTSSASSSNPSSPFTNQVVVLTGPSSPLINTASSNALPTSPSQSFIDTPHTRCPLSNVVVTSAEITQGFVSHILSNAVDSPIHCTSSSSSSTDVAEGLLRQVVPEDAFFNQQASPTRGSTLSNALSGSSLNPHSPQSPLQNPLTPGDNYVVSSSTETVNAMASQPSNFHCDVPVSVANSPGGVDSTSELMINSSSLHQRSEIDAGQYDGIETASVVMSSTHDGHIKSDALDRVQLLISSSDGSIAYNLDSQSGFLETCVVDLAADLLTPRSSEEEQHFNSVLSSFKSQGLVIGESENGELQLHHTQPDDTDADAEAKLAGALGLRDLTLNVRHSQADLLDHSLLGAPMNGEQSESVARLNMGAYLKNCKIEFEPLELGGHSLMSDDVKISIVDPSLDAVGAYTDILMESACVDDDIGGEVESGESLGEESNILDADFDVVLQKSKYRDHSEEGVTELQPSESDDKSLGAKEVADCNGCIRSLEESGKELSTQSLPWKPSRAWSTLPASCLAINRVSGDKGEVPGYGVFARKTIPKRTQFGPIEGVLMNRKEREDDRGGKEDDKKLVLLVESESGAMQELDVSKEDMSNWMRFVRVAKSFKEQNLVLSQQGHSLFFTTTKVIHPKQELCVWYNLQYAKRRGLPMLLPEEVNEKGLGSLQNVWPCFECNDRFATSEELQAHLNAHELNREESNKDDNRARISRYNFHQRRFSHFLSRRLYKHNGIFHQCRTCRRAFLRSCNLKRHLLLHSKDKYLCEVCGFQFSHMFNRDRHMRRHQDLNVNVASKCLSAFLKKKLSQKPNGTEWYCTHCHLSFDNPTVLNLHTLAHAAEDIEDTETITGLPSEVTTIYQKGLKKSDLRCPKCTKKVATTQVEFNDLGSQDLANAMKQSTVPQEQILISSSDGNTAYNLDSQSGFLETRIVDLAADLLTPRSSEEEQHFNSVLSSFKSQGLVIGESENGELQLHHTQPDDTDADAEAKLAGALGLRDLTLNVRHSQADLLDHSLLGAPMNGEQSESVARLNMGAYLKNCKIEFEPLELGGHSLMSDDVKISIVDPSLDAVGAYTDILMESACVEDDIAHKVAAVESRGHESNNIDAHFDGIALRRSKRKFVGCEGSQRIVSTEKVEALTSSGAKEVADCNGCIRSLEESGKELSTQSLPWKPSRAWSTLPASCLAINRVSGDKGEVPGYGVFARKTIPKRTQFGPIEGVLMNRKEREDDRGGKEDDKKLVLLVESESGAMQELDVSKEDMSNWMRFVRVAKSFKEQNLVLSQQGHSLFFTTTKVIHPKQELCVWYNLQYAKRRGLPMLLPEEVNEKGLGSLQNVWPCFECNDRFATSEELQIHLNVHELDREESSSGNKHYARRRNFQRKGLLLYPSRKFKRSDKQIIPYQCHTCNRAFPRNYNLKRHQLLHAKDKKYLCEVCGYQFSHMYNRDRHVRKRHKDMIVNGGSKTLSTFFKKKFGVKSNMLCGNTIGTDWFCNHCNLMFDNLAVLNLHALIHGEEFNMESERLQCPQCSQIFLSKQELIEHAEDHGKPHLQRRLRRSLNPAKPWKCDLCYKSFATDDRLQRHMLVHGAEESKPLQCDICYKRFLNNSALACHIKIHTAEKKMFECPICKNVFEQVLALKDHVHSHSLNGVYTCPQCNKVFDGYSLIRKHIRAFHSDRKHTCNYCGKLFPKLDKLRMHMLRHSDHREFLCANCGKQFKRKDKLKEHMKRMHSAERELRLAMKPHRPPAAKKFMPKVQVSPTDYHRFIYKCHTCLLGFKRRGMLVNHLAKRHPDISPDSVPELNLPILKTTRDYYCQYCEKVYKSSSKRKAHILKIHPGAELPMSNRRKGGVPEIPGLPNPTFSQTVGSITTLPHGCQWCHKQYASKAKLLQHQRKKHIDLLPESQQVPRLSRNPTSPLQQEDKTVSSPKLTIADEKHPRSSPPEQVVPQQCHQSQQQEQGHTESQLSQLQGIENVINIIPADYHITTTEEELRELQESGIIIDTTPMKRQLKVLPDGISADLLNQAMTELNQTLNEFRVSVGSVSHEPYLRIVQTSPGHITVTQSPDSPSNSDSTPSTSHILGEADPLPATAMASTTASQLQQLLSESYSLPSSPPSSPPRSWSNAHVTFTPYTAR